MSRTTPGQAQKHKKAHVFLKASPAFGRRRFHPKKKNTGLHRTTRELQTCTFEDSGLHKNHQNSTRRHTVREKKNENCGGSGTRKREILSAVDFGQFRLRPAFFFEFGQFRFRPIWISANFDFGQFLDVEFLDHKGWGPEGWRPKPGKSGVPKGGAPEGGAPEGGGEGWGAQNFTLFFFLPPQFSFFSPSLFGLFVEFWWCLKCRGAQMCIFSYTPEPHIAFCSIFVHPLLPCLNPIFKNGSFLSVVALVSVTLLVSNPSPHPGKKIDFGTDSLLLPLADCDN